MPVPRLLATLSTPYDYLQVQSCYPVIPLSTTTHIHTCPGPCLSVVVAVFVLFAVLSTLGMVVLGVLYSAPAAAGEWAYPHFQHIFEYDYAVPINDAQTFSFTISVLHQGRS